MPAPGKIRIRSPFNAFFKQYVTTVEEQVEQDIDCENPYYLPQVIDILMKDYMPLIPLWNGFMVEVEGNEKKTRDNNAPVETWFHIVKDNILRKERSLIHKDLKGRLR